MKKGCIYLLTGVLMVSMLGGCGKNKKEETTEEIITDIQQTNMVGIDCVRDLNFSVMEKDMKEAYLNPYGLTDYLPPSFYFVPFAVVGDNTVEYHYGGSGTSEPDAPIMIKTENYFALYQDNPNVRFKYNYDVGVIPTGTVYSLSYAKNEYTYASVLNQLSCSGGSNFTVNDGTFVKTIDADGSTICYAEVNYQGRKGETYVGFMKMIESKYGYFYFLVGSQNYETNVNGELVTESNFEPGDLQQIANSFMVSPHDATSYFSEYGSESVSIDMDGRVISGSFSKGFNIKEYNYDLAEHTDGFDIYSFGNEYVPMLGTYRYAYLPFENLDPYKVYCSMFGGIMYEDFVQNYPALDTVTDAENRTWYIFKMPSSMMFKGQFQYVYCFVCSQDFDGYIISVYVPNDEIGEELIEKFKEGMSTVTISVSATSPSYTEPIQMVLDNYNYYIEPIPEEEATPTDAEEITYDEEGNPIIPPDYYDENFLPDEQ